ncbi:polysaccharide biosynthesis protein [Pusillimonas sp. TS35]|uniref:polysaccharide biosynthesis protein n=1 Tax=Paracandidimonas lactea TaxID=2895524 RepID=UPI00136BE4FA|nr:nucleoside-diphosphate sugar epimerase/dehydratase [Paracandidimonas lactea]MYN13571.1 polysaccharide biosynthesis protein [Pusillimonas sp. TS35]
MTTRKQLASSAQAPTLSERLLALPRNQKRLLLISLDAMLIWLALWLAFYLRMDDASFVQPLGGHAWLFAMAPAVTLPILARFGLYRTVTRYAGHETILLTAGAVAIASALIGATLLFKPPAIITPRSIAILYWLLCTPLVGGARLLMRQYFQHGARPSEARTASVLLPRRPQRLRVAIYGAGAAGNQLLGALRQGGDRHPVCFIDDNPDLTGRVIAGVPVYGPEEIPTLFLNKALDEVLLAIPSASRFRRAEIASQLTPLGISVRTIPGLLDVANGRVKVDELREVDISDLLGRDPVQPRPELFERCIRDRTVLVTGAGGSIGAELCRQILGCRPRVLILYEHAEFNLYSIQKELDARIMQQKLDIEIVAILASVRDEARLFDVMSVWQVHTVYHAAAYKHVPMVEQNMTEGIRNNVFGTLYAAQAALRSGVRHFVLISTDKAVRPTSTMGSSKRMAELVLQALAAETAPHLYDAPGTNAVKNRTCFTMVRFGNVLGSSGSVIPLFREQIRSGGPVTVTHPEMTRYFMTIPEASQLVIQAGAMGTGGDVFVLDMGDPVRIVDLAVNMIRLSGLTVRSPQNPHGDIPIMFVGLRPGEKLYEELLIGENVTPTEHPMIMRANESHLSWEALCEALRQLDLSIQAGDCLAVRQLFLQLVDGYTPDAGMVDWMHMSQGAPRPHSSAVIG